MSLSSKRVTVTGGAGFLGTRVVAALRPAGCQSASVIRSNEYDLRQMADVCRMYDDTQPDIVIHLAAVVGGIGANMSHPAEFLYDNLLMGTQLLHQGWKRGIEKFVTVGTVCAYP